MKTALSVLILALVMSACTPAAAPTAALPPESTAAAPAATGTPWSLVAVGNSIPYNSGGDCFGCTAFVDRYAEAITKATGSPVTVKNLSEHNGLQLDDLLEELKSDTYRQNALASADIILVSVAHNDTAWGRDDDPCDGPTADEPDWSKFNETCASAAAEALRPKFASVFSQTAALRAGKPTVFLTINRYNDWIGSEVPPEAANATKAVLDPYNAMVCEEAVANGFTCADIYHAFNGPDGLTPAGDLLAQDYTHPSDKGNERIAQVLEDLGFDQFTFSTP